MKIKTRNGVVRNLLAPLFISAALLAQNGMPAGVDLTWDPSPDTGVTNYIIYAHPNGIPTNRQQSLVRVSVGTNLVVRIENITPGRWSIGAAAVLKGVESDLSNIIILDMPFPPKFFRISLP